ncbi:cyclic AMP-responsive element-binding protein 3-like protein 3-A isoform X1 [Cyprinodon tularosa]|uniref:cyclic AMP-responsive element-binding protein 3-like protein 3-A isoform X1 n=1 Tax=Cyprinodon tularosa TaxID=77115 RepID=UPI0018E1FCFE|nr:cyclic AMP-responsive element-binding protein 3-like protein 3-A isoform X1 [Cyprinodon tularosa]
MTLTPDMECKGMHNFNLLTSIEESTGYYPWTPNESPSPPGSGADDFLDTLLHDSSVPASPLWSPCTTDNGVNEDPLVELTESPHPISCTLFPTLDTQVFPQPTNLENPPAAKEKVPDLSMDFGWESEGSHEEFGITYYLSDSQAPLLQSTCTLTVKDLLLSNLGQNAQRIAQHSLQELVLNEDEKKLLVKEGINLPCKLPLSKFEERILKKIQRKIRNKRSAQESRKKKREYVDSLEGRMAACSSQNIELQRKIQKLEETNNALLEQLSQLQALLPNSSCKTTNRGTCILVLLLSFSLLLSPNILPDPYSQCSHAEHTENTVSSPSLQSRDVGDVHSQPLPLPSVSWGLEDLRSLKMKLWSWMDLPPVHLQSPHQQGHKTGDDYGSRRSRNM